MTSETTKPIHSIVLDSGPIIKNEPSVSTLLARSETLYTIPAVIDEIRDAATRSRLETTLMPFLTLRSPTPNSIKKITDFARLTGDLEVLSKPDIQVMALAYELECERNGGDWRLRDKPGQKRLNGKPPVQEEEETKEETKVEEPKEGMPKEESDVALQGSERLEQEQDVEPSAEGSQTEEPAAVAESADAATQAPEAQLESLHISSSEEPVAEKSEAPQESPAPEESISTEAPVIEEVAASDDEADDDGEGGWITPSNIKKYQEKDLNGGAADTKTAQKTLQVATLTTDFAMQNVLLRMNLNLLSPSLQTIRQLKSWVLRCHACFYITKDMSKQFCSRCGKPTLLRTSCSTNADGTFTVHLKKNMQWNKRGNVYSIPKPVAGTANGKIVSGGGKGGWGQELILAEDQKEYVSAMTVAKRTKEKNLMDEDYLPGILTGDRGRAGGRPKVGAGRNVNAKKRNK